jgi:hypothetical protein
MVVDDFHGIRISILPLETDAPLIVDANAVLAGTVAFQLLEAIAGWNAEILKGFRGVNRDELPQHGALQLARIAANGLATEQRFRVPIPEALDHSRKVVWAGNNVKRY